MKQVSFCRAGLAISHQAIEPSSHQGKRWRTVLGERRLWQNVAWGVFGIALLVSSSVVRADDEVAAEAAAIAAEEVARAMEAAALDAARAAEAAAEAVEVGGDAQAVDAAKPEAGAADAVDGAEAGAKNVQEALAEAIKKIEAAEAAGEHVDPKVQQAALRAVLEAALADQMKAAARGDNDAQEPKAIADALEKLARADDVVAEAVEEAGEDDEEKPKKDEAIIDLEESPAVTKLLSEARRLQRNGRLSESAVVYQEIFDKYPYKVVTDEDGRHLDASLWVQRHLAANPELLDSYRRSQEPTAQRELAAALNADEPVGALEQLTQRFLLCDGGLEGALHLAAIYLEQGNATDAASVLDAVTDHPRIGLQKARWHELQAVVGIFGKRPERLAPHLEALEGLKEDGRLERLDRWQQTARIPEGVLHGATVQRNTGAIIPAELGRSLWNPGLPVLPKNNGANNNIRAYRTSPTSPASRYPSRPAMDEQRIFINNNHSITAYDRISGERQWQRDSGDDDRDATTTVNGGIIRRSSPYAGTVRQRGVTLVGDRLFGILGLANEYAGVVWGGMQRSSSGSQLVCLNRRDGAFHWQRTPEQLHEALGNAFFHGTPVAGPGRVYALLRRARNGWWESFVVAVDAKTGDLIWHRYISGMPGQTNARFPESQMLADGNNLFVVDNVGTISCRDGRSGAALWIRMAEQHREGVRNPYTGGSYRTNASYNRPPVMIEAGLLASDYIYANPVLLDPKTGRKIKSFTKGPIAKAQYLLPSGGDVICVEDSSVSLVDGASMEVTWTKAIEGGGSDLGYPAVTDDAVLVPGSQLTVLRLADGEKILEGTLIAPGNVAVNGPQIVVAGQKEVHTYMEWTVARKALNQQIEKDPLDYTRGMSLAQLALTTENYESILEGINAAVESIEKFAEANPQRRDERLTRQGDVFDQIRRMVEPNTVKDVEIRAQLFDRMASVTETPKQQVAYLLDHGAFLAESAKLKEAVHRYQTVLDSPELSEQRYEQRERGQTQADSEARFRLSRLVEEDRSLYHEFDVLAADRLAELTAGPEIDAAALVDLARRYPFAKCVPGARIAAADAYTADGQRAEAVTQLRQGFRALTSGDRESAADVVNRLVFLLESMEKPRSAGDWLKRAERTFPGLALARDGEVITIEAWRTRLAEMAPRSLDLPMFDLPIGKPVTVVGRLLAPTHQPPKDWPRDRLITLHIDELSMRTGADLKAAWSINVPDPAVQVLSLTDEQVTLWYPKKGRIVVLDAQTGEADWPEEIDLVETFARLSQQGRGAEPQFDDREERRRLLQEQVQRAQAQAGILRIEDGRAIQIEIRNGRVIQRVEPNVFNRQLNLNLTQGSHIRLNEMSIVVASHTGNVAAFDRLSGEMKWSHRLPVEQLHDLAIDEEIIAVSVVTGNDMREPGGRLYVIDAETGDLAVDAIDLPNRMASNFLAVGGPGIVVAVPGKLIGYDIGRGRISWEMKLASNPTRPITGPNRFDDDLLLLADGTGSLLPIDTVSGHLITQRIAIPEGAPQGANLQLVDDRWHFLTRDQATALNDEGHIAWRDAVAKSPKGFVRQLIGRDYVFVVGDSDEISEIQRRINAGGALPGGSNRNAYEYDLYVFERVTGRLYRKFTLGPLPEAIVPTHAAMLDHRLVLSTASRTVVIPTADAP